VRADVLLAGACKTTECAVAAARARRPRTPRSSVVNHALLVTACRSATCCRPFRALIVDEAHHLDAVFTSQSTVRQSLPKLDLLLSLVHAERRSGADLLALVRAGSKAA
jgi:Rad3-related DNA helicase